VRGNVERLYKKYRGERGEDLNPPTSHGKVEKVAGRFLDLSHDSQQKKG